MWVVKSECRTVGTRKYLSFESGQVKPMMCFFQRRPPQPCNPSLPQTDNLCTEWLGRGTGHDDDTLCCRSRGSRFVEVWLCVCSSRHAVPLQCYVPSANEAAGITMESNSAFFLPRLTGYSRAMYLLTTGDVYRGDSKHFGDLFQEIVEKLEDVLPTALNLATTVAEKTSPLANYLNRELMWRGPNTAEGMHLVDSPVLYHMFEGA